MPGTADNSEDLFGCKLNPVTFEQWVEVLDRQITSGEKQAIFTHHNLHSLYCRRRFQRVSDLYARCSHCYIDGLPICWINSLAGTPTSSSRRFSLMYRFPDLLRCAQERKWRIFYLGGSEPVVERSSARFRKEFPDLALEFNNGYFLNNASVLKKINDFKPDVLLVGMGMPKQEAWILDNISQLDVKVVTHAGGTLDFYGDGQSKPPNWLSELGLGWLHRLVCNPGRLGRRYLVEPWTLIVPVVQLALRRS